MARDGWHSDYTRVVAASELRMARLAEAERLLRDMLPHVAGYAGLDGEPFTDRIHDFIAADSASDQPEAAYCANCGHDYEQHHKGPVSADYCRHCPCPSWIAADQQTGAKE